MNWLKHGGGLCCDVGRCVSYNPVCFVVMVYNPLNTTADRDLCDICDTKEKKLSLIRK